MTFFILYLLIGLITAVGTIGLNALNIDNVEYFIGLGVVMLLWPYIWYVFLAK